MGLKGALSRQKGDREREVKRMNFSLGKKTKSQKVELAESSCGHLALAN